MQALRERIELGIVLSFIVGILLARRRRVTIAQT
jgi:hypothetical protein